MEEASLSEQDRKLAEKLLPHKEREVILTGLRTLKDYLLNQPTLPKVLLIGDTSARVFHPAIAPVARAVYQQRGLNAPPIDFFITQGNDNLLDYLKKYAHDQGIELRDIKQETLIQLTETYNAKWKVTLAARANEIAKLHGLGNDDYVLYVDDYIAGGNAVVQAQDAFSDKVNRIDAFAFMASPQAISNLPPNTFFGCIDPFVTAGNPVTDGFSFRRKNAYGQSNKALYTGVMKNPDSTVALPYYTELELMQPPDIQWRNHVHRLRNVLRKSAGELGHQVAAEISKN